jgi:hypothetical protein
VSRRRGGGVLETRGGVTADAELTLEKRAYRPGDEVRGTLWMSLPREINARSLTIRAVGQEAVKVTTAGTGKRMFKVRTKFFEENLRMVVSAWPPGYAVGEGRRERFVPGSYVFRFAYRLPAELPCSYSGINSEITYVIEANVDVPWWPDLAARREFLLLNRSGRHARLEKKWARWSQTTMVRRDYFVAMREGMAYQGDEAPTIFESSHREGETGFIAEVGKTVWRPGEVLSGYIIVKNPRHKRLRRLGLHLMGKEYAWASGHLSEFKRQEERAEVEMPEDVGPNPFPFRIRVPEDALPTVAGSCSFYCWELHMNLAVHLGFDVKESIWLTVA